jgi:hypothetical protein
LRVVDGRLAVACESDLFRALGLSYVPMHMRGLI